MRGQGVCVPFILFRFIFFILYIFWIFVLLFLYFIKIMILALLHVALLRVETVAQLLQKLSCIKHQPPRGMYIPRPKCKAFFCHGGTSSRRGRGSLAALGSHRRRKTAKDLPTSTRCAVHEHVQSVSSCFANGMASGALFNRWERNQEHKRAVQLPSLSSPLARGGQGIDDRW